MKYIQFFLSICILTSCSSIESRKYQVIDNGDYVIVPLSLNLIDELGGVDKYQVYLSHKLTLNRLEKSSSDANTEQGSIQRIHDRYKIEFDTETPGIIRSIDYEYHSGWKHCYGATAYFDTDSLSFLNFEHVKKPIKTNLIDGTTYLEIFELSSSFPKYEGDEWSIDVSKEDVFLVLHLDKDIYERLHSKKAQGRTVQ